MSKNPPIMKFPADEENRLEFPEKELKIKELPPTVIVSDNNGQGQFVVTNEEEESQAQVCVTVYLVSQQAETRPTEKVFQKYFVVTFLSLAKYRALLKNIATQNQCNFYGKYFITLDRNVIQILFCRQLLAINCQFN